MKIKQNSNDKYSVYYAYVTYILHFYKTDILYF